MSGLAALLGKERDENAYDEPMEDVSEEAQPHDPEAFDSAATEVFDAVKAGDATAFADALRSCISLSK